MKYTVDMASDGMICIPRFMKIGSSIHVKYTKVIISTIWEASVFVLLMGRVYDVCRWDDVRWHDTYIPSFMTIGSGIQIILKVLPQQLEGCNVSTTEERDFLITPIPTPAIGHDLELSIHLALSDPQGYFYMSFRPKNLHKFPVFPTLFTHTAHLNLLRLNNSY
jgi:hypothetical protein